jgi:NAD kinase
LLLETSSAFRDPKVSRIKVSEWLPESLIDAQPIELSGSGQRVTKSQDISEVEFDYVYCLGGDGTLLRLLGIIN